METPFPNHFVVSKREDLERVKDALSAIDPETEFITHRPDTKWQVVMLVNVTYFVYRTVYALGWGLLPDFLNRKPYIVALDKDRSKNPITDALCAFRCLAEHDQQQDREAATEIYYRRWVNYATLTLNL